MKKPKGCRDSTGRIPFPKDARDALVEIQKIAEDKRSHVMWEDCARWLELKMYIVWTLAGRGLKKRAAKKGAK